MGARGPEPQFTQAVLLRLTRAQEAQARAAAAATGLGVAPFIRAVLDDYMRNPHPLGEEIHR